MASRQGQVARLVAQCEKIPGWSVVRTKKGYVIRTPKGTTCWHVSGGSEYRAVKNRDADLRRLGFHEELAKLA